MNASRGQVRLPGQAPGIDGDPILSARKLSFLLLTAALILSGLEAMPAWAQADSPSPRVESPPQPDTVRAPRIRREAAFGVNMPHGAERDSLMQEIRRYSLLLGDLRDSLTTEDGELRLSPEDRARLERSVGDFSAVIERISAELSRMEFQVKDNTISLLDDAGEGIVITIPDNLDEQLTQGFHALSELILSELPDTVRVDAQRHLTWLGQRPPRPPRGLRKVVQGNVIKVWDDLLVPWSDDVRGNVVVVFGNSEVQGRVDGNVVVVFGSLQVGESAEVTGHVVTVGGRLDQAEGASVGDVFVLDPLGSRNGLSPLSLAGGGGLRGFLICQLLFLLMLTVALAAAAGAPEQKFRKVQDALLDAPAASLGIGVLATIGVHLGALVLLAVLVLTVIGIPVALLVWLALLVAGVIATAVAAAAVGERVCRVREGGCPSRWLAVLVGMLLLHLLSFGGSLLGILPGMATAGMVVSGLGALVKIGAYVFGVGALAISRFGTARSALAPAATTATAE